MNRRETAIYLVKRRTWQGRVASRLREADPQTARLTQAVLGNLHSRHCGISVGLALSLAQALQASSWRHYSPPWQAVIERLRGALMGLTGLEERESSARIGRRDAPVQGGLLFSVAVPYTIYEIVAPLVEAACEQMGRIVLFADDDHVSGGYTWQQYEDYEAQLARTINTLASDKRPTAALSQTFWQERAILLESLLPSNNREARVYPSSDLVDSTIFLRLQTDLGFGRTYRLQQRSSRNQRDNREKRHYDAGADGVELTRDLNDLDRMLMTERLNPSLVRTDRIVNSGYWVTKRPPQPVSLRHVLVVGLYPALMQPTASRGLIKTAWFDFLLHFSHILQRNDLTQSEFRWIEGDGYQRMRSQSLLVRDMMAVGVPPTSEHRAAYRHQFLKRMGWLPDYLDENAPMQTLDQLYLIEEGAEQRRNSALAPDADVPAPQDVRLLKSWVRAAWEAQTDNVRWQTEGNGARRRGQPQALRASGMNLSQFRHVHVFYFMPARYNHQESGLNLTAMKSVMRLRQASMSITWVPDNLHESDAWHFSGQRRLKQTFAYAGGVDVHKLSEQLIQVWLDSVMKEMQGG